MHPHDHPPILPTRRTRRRVRHGADGVSRHRCARARDATSASRFARHRDVPASRRASTDARTRAIGKPKNQTIVNNSSPRRATTTIGETRDGNARSHSFAASTDRARFFSRDAARHVYFNKEAFADWRSVYSEAWKWRSLAASSGDAGVLPGFGEIEKVMT